MKGIAVRKSGNGAAGAKAPKLTGTPAYVLMKRWQAKQAEKVAAELAAPPLRHAPRAESVIMAMRMHSR